MTRFEMKRKPPPTHAVPQSVAPVRQGNVQGDSDVYKRINNSLVAACIDTDSYMAKASVAGMTNSKALQVSLPPFIFCEWMSLMIGQVLAQIERKLQGYNGDSEAPLSVKKQVLALIEEASDVRNLAQGESC